MLLSPTASLAMHPIADVPVLTSWAGTPLSFVFLTPPAASHPIRTPELCFSVVHMHSGALVFSLAASFPQLTVSLYSLAGAGLRVWPLPSVGGYSFLLPECGGFLPLPFIF